jgi:hypothetical protein
VGAFGSQASVEFYTGYVVEKSLSVDNLFVFMLLLSAFAVPRERAQRVLLYGIIGALVLRAVFIALGAAALQSGTWAFLLFGAILIVTAGKAATAGAQHRDGIDACIRYLSNNAGHLRYDQALEAGWPIATGVIEGACRHLIADRFDLAGARWGRGGAEAARAGRQRSSGGVLDFPSRPATRARPPDRLPGRIRPYGLIASVTQEEPHPK